MTDGTWRPIRDLNQEQALHLASVIRKMLAERCATPADQRVRTTTVSEACIVYDVRTVVNGATGIIELLAHFLSNATGFSVAQVLDRLSPSETGSADVRGHRERARDLVRQRTGVPLEIYERRIDEFALTYATEGVETLVAMGTGIIKAIVHLRPEETSDSVIQRLADASDSSIMTQFPAP